MLVNEEKTDEIIKDINTLHDTIQKTKWNELNRDGFVFELERSYTKLKEIYLKLFEVNKEVSNLLEKNTPNIDTFLEQFRNQLTVLEANIRMEKSKKLVVELINENDTNNVPELYSSIQNKIIEQLLKCRYSIEKIKTFLINRKTPFVKKGSTAKNLIELLETKEDELVDLKKRNLELKRRVFTRNTDEKDITEIEADIYERNKNLEIAVKETNDALKTHLAQINYVEGSFANLKNKITKIEESHNTFAKNSIELIKELKKERDYAKKFAMDIEQETLALRSNYTREILNMEDQKNEIKEKINKKYIEEIKSLKRDLNEKSISLANIIKLVEEQEKEIKRLKKVSNENQQNSIYE